MINGFHTLKVHKINKETADAVTIYFEIPDVLTDTFKYKAGQYLTLATQINGEEVRRAYSLCTSPVSDKNPGVTVKKVEGGKMSTWANTILKEGDTIEVMPPNGKFTPEIAQGNATHYILFGGGSGITPMMSIIKTVLENDSTSKITLIYANRNDKSVIFKSQLETMEKANKDRLKIILSYDQAPMMWFGLKGLLTVDKISDIIKNRIGGNYLSAQYYICGPSPMMDVVRNGLQKIGIIENHVHTEYFTAPGSEKPKTENTSTSATFGGKALVKVTVYGKTHEIEISGKTTILDAANAAGLQPPYSCTVGVCTTCRAKVLKGSVEMMEREGLSDQEIEEGYVLTCQSLPRSNEIELIYE